MLSGSSARCVWLRLLSGKSANSSPSIHRRLSWIFAQKCGFWTKRVLCALLLNTKQQLMKVVSISKGILNESLAHPREIFRPVITYSAHAFILVHNHPSGDPSPSEADLRLTRRILEPSKILQLRLIEHTIIRLARSGPEQLFQLQKGRRQPIPEREPKIVFPRYSGWEQCCECCRRRRPRVFGY
jgi:hypothetical protein